MKERRGISFLGVLCIVLAVLAIGFFIAGAALIGPKDIAKELETTVRSAADGVTNETLSDTVSHIAGWIGDLGDQISFSLDSSLIETDDPSGLTDLSSTTDFAAEGLRAIEIGLTLGSVELIPSPDEQIHVSYECFLSASLAERHSFDARKVGSVLYLEQKFRGRNLSGNVKSSVSLTVSVPESLSADLEITTVNGDILLGETSASKAEVETVNGDITGTDFACGSIEAETVNGDIDLTVTAVPSSLSFQSVNGGVRVGLPAAAEFRYDLSNVNGSLAIEGFDLSEVFSESKHEQSGQVGAGSARVQLSSVNGDLVLRSNR